MLNYGCVLVAALGGQADELIASVRALKESIVEKSVYEELIEAFV